MVALWTALGVGGLSTVYCSTPRSPSVKSSVKQKPSFRSVSTGTGSARAGLLGVILSGRWDSNPRHSAWEADGLWGAGGGGKQHCWSVRTRSLAWQLL